MPLFRKLTDEEQIAKWDREDKQMLQKNYDLLPHQNELPAKAYLLKPNKLQAVGYELKGSDVYIYIGYKNNFSSYITETVRASYERIFKGTLICTGVKNWQELPYSSASSIKHSLFSSYKDLTVPVALKFSLNIQCKRIHVDNIDIYAIHNNVLIPESKFRDILKQQIEGTYR